MNTHWIDYIPGTAARITSYPPEDSRLHVTACTDVNKLSQVLNNFHDWLKEEGMMDWKNINLSYNEKIQHLVSLL